eukprot:g414.t1
MVMSLLMACPEDPPEFMLRWLLEQDTPAASLQEMFDRAGINSLEDAAREQAEIERLRKEVSSLKRQRAQMKAHLAQVVAEDCRIWDHFVRLPTPPSLDSKTVQKIKNCILRAATLGRRSYGSVVDGDGGGVDLALLFRRLDKDRSGELEINEVKAALRRVLRIPPSAVPDHQIHAFCAIVDTDFSGTVDIQDGAPAPPEKLPSSRFRDPAQRLRCKTEVSGTEVVSTLGGKWCRL